jgi:hypothetical protein
MALPTLPYVSWPKCRSLLTQLPESGRSAAVEMPMNRTEPSENRLPGGRLLADS